MSGDAFGILQKIGPYLVTKTRDGDFAILDGNMSVVQRDIPRLDMACDAAQELVKKMHDTMFPEPEPQVDEEDGDEVNPDDTDALTDDEIDDEE